MTPEQKRYFWGTLAFLTTMLTAAMLALFAASCTKPKPENAGPVLIPADSTRIHLERNVTTAKDTAKAAHQRTSQTQTPYEDAVRQYDSLRGQLPR